MAGLVMIPRSTLDRMAAASETIKSLDLADELRQGRSTAKPFDLWLAAKHESDGREARRTLFRHSMIHAGFLLTAKGNRYKRCPMCPCSLPTVA